MTEETADIRDFALIMAFIDDRLPKNEMEALDLRLERDPEFARGVQRCLTIRDLGPGATVEEIWDAWNNFGERVPDLEPIVNYLNKRLPPEEMAAVERRLETDAEFRNHAEPLIFAWSVPLKKSRTQPPRDS